MVEISKGSLSKLQNPAATISTSGIKLTWIDHSTYDDNAYPTDIILFLIYNVDKNEVYYQTTSSAIRSDQTLTLATPSAWAGDTIHIYIAARTDDSASTDISDSTYLGQYTAI